MKRYYGKYAAKVLDNVDPLMLGRILCQISQFDGLELAWCLPCVPYAGPDVGFYFIPPVGASVWVEFAGGDLDTPIWVGCFWDEGEMPRPDGAVIPGVKVLQTSAVTLVINDEPGIGGCKLTIGAPAVETPMELNFSPTGITLKLDPDIQMTFNETGITLSVPPASIRVSEAEIGLSIPETSVTLTEESATVAVPPSTLALTAEAIEAASPPSSLTIAPEAVEVLSAAASVTVSEPVIEIENGESNVSLFPVGVIVNDGALEVI